MIGRRRDTDTSDNMKFEANVKESLRIRGSGHDLQNMRSEKFRVV